MNPKNLSAKNKTHKKILSHLKNERILKIFKDFSVSLNTKEDIAIAVSGGPDSLSIAFLAKCYALKNNIKVKCFIVDHKLRKESSLEAKNVRNVLTRFNIENKILPWHGKKPVKNIQALARDKRYLLLTNECKKHKIKNLLLGHHLDDLSENFLIRLVRGSGLNGLTSFDKTTKYKNQDLNILRPLLNIEKKDLVYISKKVFNFFVKDPSNINENFKRTRIRKLLHSLEEEGLNKKKLISTINNLKDSDKSIRFYVDKNLTDNAIFLKAKKTYILKQNFFSQSHEVIFRSLTKIIQLLGKKNYPVRGKSINNLIKRIETKSFTKVTLGGCYIDSISKTILISRENKN